MRIEVIIRKKTSFTLELEVLLIDGGNIQHLEKRELSIKELIHMAVGYTRSFGWNK